MAGFVLLGEQGHQQPIARFAGTSNCVMTLFDG